MSQTDRILAHLQKEPITPLQALRLYGCLRLSGRILDLRSCGYQIKTEMVETRNGKRIAKYSLERKRPQKSPVRGLVAPSGRGT